jgi:hypothetical protein
MYTCLPPCLSKKSGRLPHLQKNILQMCWVSLSLTGFWSWLIYYWLHTLHLSSYTTQELLKFTPNWNSLLTHVGVVQLQMFWRKHFELMSGILVSTHHSLSHRNVGIYGMVSTLKAKKVQNRQLFDYTVDI